MCQFTSTYAKCHLTSKVLLGVAKQIKIFLKLLFRIINNIYINNIYMLNKIMRIILSISTPTRMMGNSFHFILLYFIFCMFHFVLIWLKPNIISVICVTNYTIFNRISNNLFSSEKRAGKIEASNKYSPDL